MGTSNVSPGVYTQELDFSLYTTRLSSSIFGTVGVSTRGPINKLTLVSNVGSLEATFGSTLPSDAKDTDGVHIGGTQALYQMGHYLKQGSIGQFVRVAGPNLAFASVSLNNVGTYYGGYVGATEALRVIAYSAGTWANNVISVQVEHLDDSTYNLYVFEQGSKQESYKNVTQATVEGRVNGVSTRITVEVLDASVIPGETLDPITAKFITVAMTGGNDGLYASTQGTVDFPNIVDGSAEDTLKIVGRREGVLCNQYTESPSLGFSVKLDETTVGLDTYLRIGAYFNGVLIPGEEFLGLTKSSLITRVNASSNWFALEDITTGLEPDAASPVTYYLTGGLRLSDIIGEESGNSITGLQIFRNSELVDTNILAAPGQYHLAVVDELIGIAEERGDCISLIAPPFDLTVNEIIDWHNGVFERAADVPFPPIAALTSSYAALIFQWVRTYDSHNDTSVWTSPEGVHASIMAFTDNTAEPWFAPAGLTRGSPSFLEDITISPRQTDRELLYGDPGTGQNAINPFVNFKSQGISLWGQRTLQRTAISLDRINVRRLLNVLKKVIATATNSLVFDPNDPTMWNQWEMLVRPFMKSVQARRGLIDWEVKMDSTTTTPLDIDQNRAVGRISIQPMKAAEQIVLQFVLTPTGVSFDEIMGGRGL